MISTICMWNSAFNPQINAECHVWVHRSMDAKLGTRKIWPKVTERKWQGRHSNPQTELFLNGTTMVSKNPKQQSGKYNMWDLQVHLFSKYHLNPSGISQLSDAKLQPTLLFTMREERRKVSSLQSQHIKHSQVSNICGN